MTSYLLVIFFLFITFDTAAQTMEVIVSEEDDEKNKLL